MYTKTRIRRRHDTPVRAPSEYLCPDPQPVPSPITTRRHIDLVKLQQEADELSKIAQTIPADVISVRHDMLPKDLLEKLKRIEKLSKHLHRELTP